MTNTYAHRSQKTEDPVRSPVLKLRTGELVVRWVTTCEYSLVYVLQFLFRIRSRYMVGGEGVMRSFWLEQSVLRRYRDTPCLHLRDDLAGEKRFR